MEYLLDDTRWWAGVPLAERLRAGGIDQIRLTSEQRRRGELRLRIWREGSLLPGLDIPLDRWYATNSLTENHLVTLLGEPLESVRARIAQPPAWLAIISDAWRRHGMPPPEHEHGHDSDGPGQADAHEKHHHHEVEQIEANNAFLRWIRPLLVWARHELLGRIDALAATRGLPRSLPLDHSLLAPPLDHILTMIKRVLVLGLNVARVEGQLTGNTAQERFESFADRLADPEYALDLLVEFPVLARELVSQLNTWIEVRAEFIARLLEDLPALRDAFGVRCEGLSDLADVEFGAGDAHGGGRSVAIASFADGGKVVYKPRSLAIERHFNDLLRWLSSKGLRYPLRPSSVLDRGKYGWAAFITAEPCPDTPAVNRFFWRHGAYLALFYALRSSDFHLENLIAAGEHPAFVDLESMFHAAPRFTDDQSRLSGPATQVIQDSVLTIGLLPQRIIEFDETGAHDLEVSGLAGGAGPDQLTPHPVVWFAAPATDEMRVVRERVPILGTSNRPMLGESPVDPREHSDQLVAGFEECYRLLLAERQSLLHPEGPIAAFADAEVRPILRNTMFYAKLLGESWHPDVLRDSLDREYLLEKIVHGLDGMTCRDAVLASESAQLARQDIPAFHTTPGSSDLHDGAGVVAVDFLESTGLEAVRARLNKLTERDLDQQRWCIRASLSGLDVGDRVRHHPSGARPLPSDGIELGVALDAARRIGDDLIEVALEADDTGAAEWLSLNLVGDRYWAVGPSGLGLYSGSSGIVLFLAELGVLTGEPRYRRLAEDVAEIVVEQAQRFEEMDPALRKVFAVGGFEDLGGMLYLLTRLGQLWNEPSLLDPASQLVAEITSKLADDKFLDVVAGTAGAALALLSLHRLRPAETTAAAIRQAGDVLLARAEQQEIGLGWPSEMSTHRPLAGFSHGASGYAYTLARIAELTGEKRYLDTAVAALRFEHELFNPVEGNWADLRSINTDGEFMNAWCHGAAGIGLARAAMLGLPCLATTQESIRADLRLALAAVRRDLVRDGRYHGIGNDSICHGDLGLVETLLTAGLATGDDESCHLATRAAAVVARRVLSGQVRTGVPLSIPTPGLMTGAAGIGYGLLRSAAPERVPSILLLGGEVEPRVSTGRSAEAYGG